MSSAVPAIPLFGDAYLADTRHLTLEEHGAYLQLIMIAWRIEGCCLPDDDARLARMLGVSAAKWRKLKPVVMDFWTLENGTWTQARLSKERAYVEEKRAKNKEAAEKRWKGQASENKGGDECERISERNAPPPPPPLKEVSKEEATPPLVRQPIQEAVSIWSEAAERRGWKPVHPSLSDLRRKHITARLREHGLEGWRAGIARAEASAMLGGHDPPGWFTFNFIIKAENFLKLIEGNYDRNFSHNSGQRGSSSGWETAFNANLG